MSSLGTLNCDAFSVWRMVFADGNSQFGRKNCANRFECDDVTQLSVGRTGTFGKDDCVSRLQVILVTCVFFSA